MDNPDSVIDADAQLEREAVWNDERILESEIGARTAQALKGRLDASGTERAGTGDDAAEEGTSLLPRKARGQDQDHNRGTRDPTQSVLGEFEGLPWYQRPSIYWVLAPFFLAACAFGGVISPKINLTLELICQQYLSEQQMLDPSFTTAPVDFNNGNNDQCRIPEVQSRTSNFTLICTVIAGCISAVTSPKLGALSDRYGRKPILIATSVGTMAGEIITIFAATYPQSFPVDLLIVGYALDGLTGSFIVALAVSNAYATDCTSPAVRSTAIAFFHGCLFTGIAVGPIIAGYVVKMTGKVVVVFYGSAGAHIFFIVFVALFVPESVSKRRQALAREKNSQLSKDRGSDSGRAVSHKLNVLAPLAVLRPTGPGSSPELRRNLFLLAAVDTIMFGVAMGSMSVILLYTNYLFGWKTFEQGRWMTIVNMCRVFGLVVILPLLTRLFRRTPDLKRRQQNAGCDTLDVSVIRGAVLFDTMGYVGYALATSGDMMILSGVVASIGGIGSPTLQSSLTKHVPAEQTGTIMGASGLLHALARVIAPIVFNGIYSATVGRFTQTVFVCLASTFGLAFLLSWFLRTGSMCLAEWKRVQ